MPPNFYETTAGIFTFYPVGIHSKPSKVKSVKVVGQKSVICYIQMVVVALLSVDLVESVDLVSVDLVVNCISLLSKNNGGPANKYSLGS